MRVCCLVRDYQAANCQYALPVEVPGCKIAWQVISRPNVADLAVQLAMLVHEQQGKMHNMSFCKMLRLLCEGERCTYYRACNH